MILSRKNLELRFDNKRIEVYTLRCHDSLISLFDLYEMAVHEVRESLGLQPGTMILVDDGGEQECNDDTVVEMENGLEIFSVDWAKYAIRDMDSKDSIVNTIASFKRDLMAAWKNEVSSLDFDNVGVQAW